MRGEKNGEGIMDEFEREGLWWEGGRDFRIRSGWGKGWIGREGASGIGRECVVG